MCVRNLKFPATTTYIRLRGRKLATVIDVRTFVPGFAADVIHFSVEYFVQVLLIEAFRFNSSLMAMFEDSENGVHLNILLSRDWVELWDGYVVSVKEAPITYVSTACISAFDLLPIFLSHYCRNIIYRRSCKTSLNRNWEGLGCAHRFLYVSSVGTGIDQSQNGKTISRSS